jgi:hypothetical protein
MKQKLRVPLPMNLGSENGPLTPALPMNLWSEDGPLTPALSPKGEREQTSQNLHRFQGFKARIFRGNLYPIRIWV